LYRAGGAQETSWNLIRESKFICYHAALLVCDDPATTQRKLRRRTHKIAEFRVVNQIAKCRGVRSGIQPGRDVKAAICFSVSAKFLRSYFSSWQDRETVTCCFNFVRQLTQTRRDSTCVEMYQSKLMRRTHKIAKCRMVQSEI